MKLPVWKLVISKERAISKLKVKVGWCDFFEWTTMSLLPLQSVAATSVLAPKVIVCSGETISGQNIIKIIHKVLLKTHILLCLEWGKTLSIRISLVELSENSDYIDIYEQFYLNIKVYIYLYIYNIFSWNILPSSLNSQFHKKSLFGDRLPKI